TFGYAYCANLLNSGKSDLENCSSFTASESGSAPAPFAPGGPYLAETTSVIRIYEDEEAKNMLQSFFLAQSENTLGRDGFRLASPRSLIIYILRRMLIRGSPNQAPMRELQDWSHLFRMISGCILIFTPT
ncbi:MAG: hypothetical protein ACPHAN_15320, partial [Pseudomonadales bacterium]